MAPVNRMKTYSRHASESARKFGDTLFQLNANAKTSFKAKRNVIKTFCSSNSKLLHGSNSLLNITVNDTFDKLLKGDVHQPVEFKENVKYFTSDSDLSKSKHGLASFTLSTSVHSPLAKKRRRRKRNLKRKKVETKTCQPEIGGILAQSVNYSLEVEKCNLSSLYRYHNTMNNNEKTTNNGLSVVEPNSTNISFDVPQICSTPMPLNLQLNPPKEIVSSPISSRVKSSSAEQRLQDSKLLQVPFVRLNRISLDCIEIVGVESSENFTKNDQREILSDKNDEENVLSRELVVNLTRYPEDMFTVDKNPSENQKINNSSSVIFQTETDEGHSFLNVIQSTPVNSFVNRKRRGRPRKFDVSFKGIHESFGVLQKETTNKENQSNSVQIEDVSELIKLANRSEIDANYSALREFSQSIDPSANFITLRSRQVQKANDSESGISKRTRTVSDRFASDASKSVQVSIKTDLKNQTESIQSLNSTKHSQFQDLENVKANLETETDLSRKMESVLNQDLEDLMAENLNESNRKSELIESLNTTDVSNQDLNNFITVENIKTENDLSRKTEFLNTTHISNQDSATVNLTDVSDCFIVPDLNTVSFKKPVLKSGKLWRRSLLLHRKSSIVGVTNNSIEKTCKSGQGGPLCDCVTCKINKCCSKRRMSQRIVPVRESEEHDLSTVIEISDVSQGGYVSAAPNQANQILAEAVCELSLNIRNSLVLTTKSTAQQQPLSARDIVLRKCGQTEPLPFEECYPNKNLQHCHKIGEGVYGEVFLKRNTTGDTTTVMKVIPIEGNLIVNGDRQKKFEEILSEISIATALSELRYNELNQTSCFSEVQNVKCVQGRYPNRLLDLWELYNEDRGSENDSPEIFNDDQLFLVLELANGGSDLESYVFNNTQQSYAIFKQIACALAVAETALYFEHRDLHWGNVLIKTCDKKKIVTFKLDGEEILVPTFGVEACIIDFTLSRITHDNVVFYNDLSQDEELFTAEGDYQFEIYRLMQEKNGNEWQHFEPYTNVQWLHYILDKMVFGVRYSRTNSKLNKSYLAQLRQLKATILKFGSAREAVTTLFL